MSDIVDQVRPWVDSWVVFVIGVSVAVVAVAIALQKVWLGIRALHRAYVKVAAGIETQQNMTEMFVANGAVLDAIGRQFNTNGGSSLRDVIDEIQRTADENHSKAELHWNEISQTTRVAVDGLTQHLLNLDEQWKNRDEKVAAMQTEVKELREKLDRWIHLVTDVDDVPRP